MLLMAELPSPVADQITVWTADDVTPIDREISVPFRDDLYFLKFAPEPGNRFTVLCPTPTVRLFVCGKGGEGGW